MIMNCRSLIEKSKSIGVRQGDFIVVALLLVLSLVMMCFGMFGGDNAQSVRICVNGEEVALLPVDRDIIFIVPGGLGNVVEISGGSARMIEADCPDGSCVGQGSVFQTGECIVCLPARVTITIVSDDSTDGLDAVAY